MKSEILDMVQALLVGQALPGDEYLVYLAFAALPLAAIIIGACTGYRGVDRRRNAWSPILYAGGLEGVAILWVSIQWGGVCELWSSIDTDFSILAMCALNGLVGPLALIVGVGVGHLVGLGRGAVMDSYTGSE